MTRRPDEPMTRSGGSAKFYKSMAAVFFVLAAIFISVAVYQRSWFYGVFGAITVMNGLMSIVKSHAAGAARQ